MTEDLTPDGRYLADQQCWPGRAECTFATGLYGEPVGVAFTRAPVTANSTEREGDGWITCSASPDAARGARVAVNRATKDALEARDALNRFLSSLDDLREALDVD